MSRNYVSVAKCLICLMKGLYPAKEATICVRHLKQTGLQTSVQKYCIWHIDKKKMSKDSLDL